MIGRSKAKSERGGSGAEARRVIGRGLMLQEKAAAKSRAGRGRSDMLYEPYLVRYR